jgi:hypothetical protein
VTDRAMGKKTMYHATKGSGDARYDLLSCDTVQSSG